MNKMNGLILAAALVCLMPALHAQKDPMVGGAAMYPTKNIVENALNSKDHTTLVAAVKAAGLVDTLEGAGPFTVFAPTNEAFAKLPAGTVDNLLKPENKDQLTKVLTYHVVPGRLTEKDLKNFGERGECIAKQFDGFEVEKGLHENGKLVEGESIADLGGLTISFAAYEKSIEGKPREKDANGFTPEQRFFMGYAAAAASKMRPEFARLLANSDPHPLPQFRVNGPMSNMEAFRKAFGCQKGDAMVREDACRIW